MGTIYVSREKIVYVPIAVILLTFFLIKHLHAYVQCVYIAKAKHQIAPSKADVGDNQPMKALP